MPARSIYRSKTSEAIMMACYDRQMSDLQVHFDEATVQTRYGNTHVIIAGPRDGPPLMTLHGGNGNTPLNLSLFRPLLQKYCVYAPDTVGQPGKSSQTRPSASSNALGNWVMDILDGLGIDSIPFVTSSFSSGILLQTAVLAPERISKAVLHVPSGISHGAVLPMVTKLMIPWILYSHRPDPSKLLDVFLPMMTDVNQEFLQYTDLMLRHYRMALQPPREVHRNELNRFNAPVMLLAAKEDIFFPAHKVIPRAKQLFRNLAFVEEIEGNHLSSKKTLEHVNRQIDRFLGGERPLAGEGA